MWCESQHSSVGTDEGGWMLDFTTVDNEPAILARNIVLLHAALHLPPDGVDRAAMLVQIWNMFYNVFIDDSTWALLREIATELLASSETDEAWKDSPVGAFVTFGTQSTRSQIRSIWETYAADDFPEQCPAAGFQTQQRSRMRARMDLAGVKAEGERLKEAIGTTGAMFYTMQVMPMRQGGLGEHDSIVQAVSAYAWDGAVDPQTGETAQLEIVNPMMARTWRGGLTPCVHIATFPPCAFNLVHIIADAGGEVTVAKLYQGCLRQLDQWLGAFAAWAGRRDNSLRICVLAMHASDVCDLVLRAASPAHQETKATAPRHLEVWQAADHIEPINVDCSVLLPPHEPTDNWSFGGYDLIDSSNLADYLGLLNLLVVAAPLLARQPHATLVTDTIAGQDTGTLKEVMERDLCMGHAEAAVLLDLAPWDAWLPVGLQNRTFAQFESATMGFQSQKRILWRRPRGLDQHAVCTRYAALEDDPAPLAVAHHRPDDGRVIMTTSDFAAMMLPIYMRMMHGFALPTARDLANIKRFASFTQKCTQLSFARLLALATRHVRLVVDAPDATLAARDEDASNAVEAAFMKTVYESGLMMQGNFNQEIWMDTHTFGPVDSKYGQLSVYDAAKVRYRDLNTGLVPRSAPRAAHVVLWIPRNAFPPLWNNAMFASVPICMNVGHPAMGREDRFGNVHQAVVRPPANDAERARAVQFGTLSLVECPASDLQAGLIVVCLVPSYILCQAAAKDLVVDIRASDVRIVNQLKQKKYVTDENALFFKTTLNDPKHTAILFDFPGAADQPIAEPCMHSRLYTPVTPTTVEDAASESPAVVQQAVVVHASPTIQEMVCRVEIRDKTVRALLADATTTIDVRGDRTDLINANSPCSATFVLTPANGQAVSVTVSFPVPIDHHATGIKFSRKAFYVDVTAYPLAEGRCVVQPFSLIRTVVNRRVPRLGWTLPRVNLDSLPVLDPVGHGDWLYTLASLQMSDEERKERERPGPMEAKPDLVNMKDSLHSILCSVASRGHSPMSFRWFTLCSTDQQGHGSLYVHALRADKQHDSVVIDASVCLFEHAFVRDVGPWIARQGPTIQVITTPGELRLWKALLCAAAERLVGVDAHGADCEYLRPGSSIPLSLASGGQVVCSCLAGKNLPEEFVKATPSNVVRRMYRVAIPLLFAPAHLASLPAPAPHAALPPAGPPDATLARGKPSRAKPDDECHAPSCRNKGTKACSRCRSVRYCSQDCQKVDWKAHKTVCSSM